MNQLVCYEDGKTKTSFLFFSQNQYFLMVITMRSKNISTWCKSWCKNKWKQLKQLGFLDWLIIISIIVFISVMFSLGSCYPFTSIECLLDTSTKKETLTFIGIGIGGLVLWQRTLSTKEQAEATVATTERQAKANEITEAGHAQERLKTSIEHLGDDKVPVRIGATFELYHLATGREDYRETVCHILCGHIRQTTQETNYQKQHANKPSEEIQTFLNLLCGKEKGHVFNPYKRDLTSSFLQGANLKGAQLQGTDLAEAQLQGANLLGAQLQGANLWKVQLQGANLKGSQLQGANLERAQLQRANLLGAQLQGAQLLGAQLQGANLAKAPLQGANLAKAQLQGANLRGAQLQGVSSLDAPIYLTFQEWIRKGIEQGNDFTNVTFSGGLSADQVEEIIASMPSGVGSVEKEELKSRLSRHIDQVPSNKLPENSRAITGKYSKEEAQQWIKEYNKAMESVPKQQPDSAINMHVV